MNESTAVRARFKLHRKDREARQGTGKALLLRALIRKDEELSVTFRSDSLSVSALLNVVVGKVPGTFPVRVPSAPASRLDSRRERDA